MNIKILVIIVLFASSVESLAQAQTDGFWGIPFLTTQEKAIQLIEANKHLKPTMNERGSLAYMQADFAGEEAAIISILFYGNRMYNGLAAFRQRSFALILQRYEEWKSKLSQKYGTPKLNEYWPQYAENDDSYMLKEAAIQDGEAKMSSAWRTTDERTNNPVSIVLFITSNGELVLSFTDININAEAEREIEKEAQKDY